MLIKCESEGLVLTLMIQWPFSYIYFSICFLQSFVENPVRAATTPHNDAGAEDALHHTPISSRQDWFPQSHMPCCPEETETIMGMKCCVPGRNPYRGVHPGA